MNKIFLYIGGFILLAIVMVAIVFFLTQGMAQSTDKFFSLIQQQKSEEAYQLTATAFRSSTTLDQFKSFIEQLGLDQYQSSLWSSRSIENDRGTLEGSVTTSAGKIALKVYLVKEGNDWKILRIEQPQAGVQDTNQADNSPSMPTDQENLALIQNTLADFVKASASKDFTIFYGNISELWKAQTTPDDLKKLFVDFVTKDIDLTFLSMTQPVLNKKPVIDENGILLLEGSYPAKNHMLNFKLKYIYEHPSWKLMGIEVNAG